MSIKHSLLALLQERPRYGYELKQEFEARTGGSWPLNIGQVYSTLDRCERDGLVTKSEADADGRVTYALTTAGRDEVTSWFATPLEVSQPPRNELAIKLAIAVSVAGVDVMGLIQAQRTATLHTLQTYTRAKRDADPADTAWLLIVELMIFTAQAEAQWLDYCEANLTELRRQSATRRQSAAAPSPTPASRKARR